LTRIDDPAIPGEGPDDYPSWPYIEGEGIGEVRAALASRVRVTLFENGGCPNRP